MEQWASRHEARVGGFTGIGALNLRNGKSVEDLITVLFGPSGRRRCDQEERGITKDASEERRTRRDEEDGNM